MDRLKQIEAFVSAATRGSLSAAARVEEALEERAVAKAEAGPLWSQMPAEDRDHHLRGGNTRTHLFMMMSDYIFRNL